MEKKRQLRVAFLHPDLGIGGAERLVVDAAVELAERGHSVTIFTAHHNRHRCFPETVSGLFDVVVFGDWLPRHVCGRFHALCAYARCCYVALCVVALSFLPPLLSSLTLSSSSASSSSPPLSTSLLPSPISSSSKSPSPSQSLPSSSQSRSKWRFDAAVVDQVSAVIPILKLGMPRCKVLFYCHFPDMLLARRGTSMWSVRAVYRAPIDWLEQVTTGMADEVVVNSNFTAAVFNDTFRLLAARGVRPLTLYPAVCVPKEEAEATVAADVKEAAESAQSSSMEAQRQMPLLPPDVAAAVADMLQRRAEAEELEEKGKAGGSGTRLGSSVSHANANDEVDGGGEDEEDEEVAAIVAPPGFVPRRPFFLSLNRFERKKTIGIAIEAFAMLLGAIARESAECSGKSAQDGQQDSNAAAAEASSSKAKAKGAAAAAANLDLVVAGGYDVRVHENVEHLQELRRLARRCGGSNNSVVNGGADVDVDVASHVHFCTSISDEHKANLISSCIAVLYTPQNEHFGIVPLEAMAAGVPVIACNSGGPVESVAHNVTGLLAHPTPAAFAAAMASLLLPTELITTVEHVAREGGSNSSALPATTASTHKTSVAVTSTRTSTRTSRASVMGRAAAAHVRQCFSRSAFGDRLESLLLDMLSSQRSAGVAVWPMGVLAAIAGVAVAAVVARVVALVSGQDH